MKILSENVSNNIMKSLNKLTENSDDAILDLIDEFERYLKKYFETTPKKEKLDDLKQKFLSRVKNILTKYNDYKDDTYEAYSKKFDTMVNKFNKNKTLKENTNFKTFKSEKEIEDEFDGKAYKFYDNEIDHNINYIGDMKAGNCKQNAILAKENDPENNPEVYLGYIVMKDKNGKFCGIKHYFNVNNGLVMEHTPVRDTQLYKSGELQYYIGEEI